MHPSIHLSIDLSIRSTHLSSMYSVLSSGESSRSHRLGESRQLNQHFKYMRSLEFRTLRKHLRGIYPRLDCPECRSILATRGGVGGAGAGREWDGRKGGNQSLPYCNHPKPLFTIPSAPLIGNFQPFKAKNCALRIPIKLRQNRYHQRTKFGTGGDTES